MDKIIDRCRAEVSISAIKRNLSALQHAVPDASILSVIKADAYGHGALRTASLLEENGLSFFCVATVEEGVQLREAGFESQKILVLGSFFTANIAHYLKWRLIPTVSDLSHIKALNLFGKKVSKQIECHLKVDTGMNRYGFSSEELIKKCDSIFRYSNVEIAGIYSHLSNSPIVDDSFTIEQIAEYKKVTDYLELNNIWFGLRHLLNSGGIINYPDSAFDAVRPGLSLYGYYPGAHSHRVKLHPAMSFKTRIVAIKEVAAGASIGYSRSFRAPSAMTIALLPVGYADGYSTAFSNKGKVLVGRHICPVIGRVCMDTTIIDITGIKAKLGETVLLWGGGHPELQPEKVAASIDSIPYELTCRVSTRVPRVYVS